MTQDNVYQKSFRTTYVLVFTIVLTLLTVLTPAHAQTPVSGPYVLTTYDIEELGSRPGKLVVGTDVLTILEFDDQISNVATGRASLLKIEVQGNRILLRANQNAGATDLVVNSAGFTALFTVQVDEALTAPQRYVIGTVEVPAPRVSRSGTYRHFLDGASLLDNSQTKREPSLVTADKLTSANEATIPDWLAFHAVVTYAPNGVLAVRYALSNQSEHYLAADATQLRLMAMDPIAGPQQLPYKLSRISAPGVVNRVAPGGVEFGTLLVRDAPNAPIVLTWPLVQIGPAKMFTLKRRFHAGFLHEPRP